MVTECRMKVCLAMLRPSTLYFSNNSLKINKENKFSLLNISTIEEAKYISCLHDIDLQSDEKSANSSYLLLTSSGLSAEPNCLGDYTPTKKFSAGRRVFKHKSQERYLLVEAGHVPWYVKESVDSEEAYYMHSGCAPSMCPADPRARTREDTGQVSWGYWDGDGRNWTYTGGITIKCSVHTY